MASMVGVVAVGLTAFAMLAIVKKDQKFEREVKNRQILENRLQQQQCKKVVAASAYVQIRCTKDDFGVD